MRSLPAGLGAQLSPDDEVIALLLLLGSSGRRDRGVEQRRRSVRLIKLPPSSPGSGCCGNCLPLHRVTTDEADEGFSFAAQD